MYEWITRKGKRKRRSYNLNTGNLHEQLSRNQLQSRVKDNE